jgi:hypothetical protein
LHSLIDIDESGDGEQGEKGVKEEPGELPLLTDYADIGAGFNSADIDDYAAFYVAKGGHRNNQSDKILLCWLVLLI